ncbi:hypothetical protein ABZ137_17390 [Streptomyces bobili]|uniref:hypothetical protein n=1 Tax=Streptomyces bobili TaxID=67280 RepID=UPI0033A4F577
MSEIRDSPGEVEETYGNGTTSKPPRPRRARHTLVLVVVALAVVARVAVIELWPEEDGAAAVPLCSGALSHADAEPPVITQAAVSATETGTDEAEAASSRSAFVPEPW